MDRVVTAQLAGHRIPGAAVTVVADGRTVLSAGYGVADVEQHTPVDAVTTGSFPASVTKLFTATAASQLIAQGRIDPDADVNGYLRAFQIHDTFPDRPVTMHHLLTHTAGFDKNFVGLNSATGTAIAPLGATLAALQPARVRPPGTPGLFTSADGQERIAFDDGLLAGTGPEATAYQRLARYQDPTLHQYALGFGLAGLLVAFVWFPIAALMRRHRRRPRATRGVRTARAAGWISGALAVVFTGGFVYLTADGNRMAEAGLLGTPWSSRRRSPGATDGGHRPGCSATRCSRSPRSPSSPSPSTTTSSRSETSADHESRSRSKVVVSSQDQQVYGAACGSLRVGVVVCHVVAPWSKRSGNSLHVLLHEAGQPDRRCASDLAPPAGFEPATPALGERCSIP